MAKYFNSSILAEMNDTRKRIFSERTAIYSKYKIDILDTDALSALSVYEIVSKYDPDYNINFSRNGEDARSGVTLIEQKAARVQNDYTKNGKIRKNAGRDAAFQFHAMGDLEHDRYIFVARCSDDLSVLRVYDIADAQNRKIILDHLMQERQAWLDRSKQDPAKMKRDIIMLTEKTLLTMMTFKSKMTINDCLVYKD